MSAYNAALSLQAIRRRKSTYISPLKCTAIGGSHQQSFSTPSVDTGQKVLQEAYEAG